jgi:hypothetical protein
VLNIFRKFHIPFIHSICCGSPYMDSSSFANTPSLTLRCDCSRISGLLLRASPEARTIMGYSRAGSLSLLRARGPRTVSGFACAGSTCWPSTACFAIVVGSSSLYYATRFSSGRYCTRVIIGSLGQHRPRYARHLIRQCHCGDIMMSRLCQVCYPTAQPIILARSRT